MFKVKFILVRQNRVKMTTKNFKRKLVYYKSYMLYHIHKINEELKIFNFKIIIIFIIAICLLILPIPTFIGLNNLNIIQIPNFIGISDTQAASNILISGIGALASILGVVIAVILVAFNLLRKQYNLYAFKTFFKEKKLSELITIYISTIIIAYLTLISISNPLKPQTINLIYFSIFLFIFSLLIVFPYSNKIISSTQSKKNIELLVNQINKSHIAIFEARTNLTPPYIISKIEESPIYTLSELGKRTLKDDERIISMRILVESERKLFSILDEYPKNDSNNHIKYNVNEDPNQEKRSIINGFLLIVKSISYQAVELKQEGVLRNVWGFIEDIYDYCFENNIPYYTVIELDYFIENLLNESLNVKLDDTTKIGLQITEEVMEKQLKNNLEKNEVFNFLSRDRYIRIISKITERAIELDQNEIVDAGIFYLDNLVLNILNMEIESSQKHSVIKTCCNHIKYLILEIFEKDIHKGNYNLDKLASDARNAILKNEEDIFREILFSISQILFTLNRKELLDWNSLNILAGIGRISVSKLNDNIIYRKSIIFIIKVFDTIRNRIEEKENLTNKNKSSYLDLYKQTSSLKEYLIKEERYDTEIEILINDVLSNFNLYEEIKKEIEEDIITIKWPEIKEQ